MNSTRMTTVCGLEIERESEMSECEYYEDDINTDCYGCHATLSLEPGCEWPEDEKQRLCRICAIATITKLEAELAAYRWIPVGERLPEDTRNVLVTDDVTAWVTWWSINTEKWISVGRRIVTHWMPIPALP